MEQEEESKNFKKFLASQIRKIEAEENLWKNNENLRY